MPDMSYKPGIALSIFVLLLGCFACTGEVGSESSSADASANQPLDAASQPSVDAAPSAGPDAAAETDAAEPSLASASGCFFTVDNPDSHHEIVFGEAGARYASLRIEYDVVHGGWRNELFDREVLNHNLMGLKRNVPDFVGRYILGNAAQIRPAETGLARKSLFYGRVDLEPRPDGQGYMGYTAWRDNFKWVPGKTYHVTVVLDAIARTQRLTVTDGVEQRVLTGDIDYWEPSLSESTFTLTLGGMESDGREVNAVGWQFCDLVVRGETL